MLNNIEKNYFFNSSKEDQLNFLKLSSQTPSRSSNINEKLIINKDIETANIVKHKIFSKNNHFNDTSIKENAYNNIQTLPGGINPSVTLASLISREEYVYERDFLGKRYDGTKITINDIIPMQNRVDAISVGQGIYNGWFDNFVVRLKKDVGTFQSIEDSRRILGGRTGDQLPFTKPNSYNPPVSYVSVKNIPFFPTYSSNIYENQRNINMFGYDISEEGFEKFKQELSDIGDFNMDISLVGDPAIGAQGLLNHSAIVKLDDADVSNLGFGGIYKSITDMIIAGPAVINGFMRNLGLLIGGSVPSSFDQTKQYNKIWQQKTWQWKILLFFVLQVNISR